MDSGKVAVLNPVSVTGVFNGEEYHLWSVKMKMFLIANNLWSVVAPEEDESDDEEETVENSPTPAKKTAKAAEEAAAAEETAKAAEKEKKKRDEMRKRQDYVALACISMALSGTLIVGLGVNSMTSGRDLWAKLESAYATRGIASKLLLKKRFAQLVMEEEEDVQAYINRVHAVVDELAAYGEKVADDEVVVKMLLGLPTSWAAFVTAMESVDPSVMNSHFLAGRLRQEHVKRKERQQQLEVGQELAMLALRNRPDRSGSAQVRPMTAEKRSCWHCGEVGHLARNCPKKKEEYLNRGRQQQSHARAAQAAKKYDAYMFTMSTNKTALIQGGWLIDSGATEHMCADRQAFVSYESVERDVVIGDGSVIRATGRGDVELSLSVEGHLVIATLANVLHVPSMATNLFSVSAATRLGYRAVFGVKDVKFVAPDGAVAACGERIGDMFHLVIEQSAVAAVAVKSDEEDEIWHQRFGHISMKAIAVMKKSGAVTGLDDFSGRGSGKHGCVACAEGKQHVQPVGHMPTFDRAAEPLELVHTDVVGPMKTPSYSGHRYYVVFVDDHSRRTWTVPMHNKSEVMDIFKQFKAMAEKKTGKTLKVLRSDN